MGGWVDGYVDGWMGGWMGRWVDGWMDGWMEWVVMELGRPHFESPQHHISTVTLGMEFNLLAR